MGDGGQGGAMGQFGRIASLSDLPDDATLRTYVRKAAALRAATRERRTAQAVAWLAEGKPRNWKYM